MSRNRPKWRFFVQNDEKTAKIRYFDRALTNVGAGISAFWHFSTKNEAKFVQNNHLTNSQNYVIIVSESEGSTMGDAMLIGFIGFIIVTIISDFFMNRY